MRISPEELRRIRHSSELLGYSVAVLLAARALLPAVPGVDRNVAFGAAALLAVFVLTWFRLVPESAFAEGQFVAAGLALIPGATVLLALTGGESSPYLLCCLFPLSLTVFATRIGDTVRLVIATLVGLAFAALLSAGGSIGPIAPERLAAAILEIALFTAFVAFAGQAMRQTRAGASARANALAGERSRALELATIDELTGLRNRRPLVEASLRLALDTAGGSTFSVIALDLDGLKQLNDIHGHAAGDAAIKLVAEVMQDVLRGSDVASRTGGDEFLALLPRTRLPEAERTIERIELALSRANWSAIGAPVRISGGAAEWRAGQTVDEVIALADARLYEMKTKRKTVRV